MTEDRLPVQGTSRVRGGTRSEDDRGQLQARSRAISDDTRTQDGLSHTDYLLLERELGAKYAPRIMSSERVMMDYIIRPVPTEIDLLKTLRQEEEARLKQAFASVKPGVTRNRDVGLDVFRRRGIGVSQRGRTPGHENVVIQGGDILAAPSQGMYAYVLRKGETEPPPDIKKLWGEYPEG